MSVLLSCLVSAALVGGFVMTLVGVNKNVMGQYVHQLTPQQMEMHQSISRTRLSIWLVGLLLGGGIAWMLSKQTKLDACSFTAVVVIVNYLFYTLTPKPSMAGYLRPDQLDEYKAVGRMMSKNYHFGIIVGVIAMYLIAQNLL